MNGAHTVFNGAHTVSQIYHQSLLTAWPFSFAVSSRMRYAGMMSLKISVKETMTIFLTVINISGSSSFSISRSSRSMRV